MLEQLRAKMVMVRGAWIQVAFHGRGMDDV
jgi:hypothetical protein